MKVTIEIADEITVGKGPRDKSWRAETTVKVGELSSDILARLLTYGIVQKTADSASTATTQAEAQSMIDAARDGFIAGTWSQRGSGGSGVDLATRLGRSIVRAEAKRSMGTKSADWIAFTALSDADQLAKLDELIAANQTAVDAAVADEIERRNTKVPGKFKIKL